MACSTIDDWMIGNEFAIVDQDGPEVDEDEQGYVSPLLHWEEERKDVIRHALREAVNWVEGVRRKRRGQDPFVMGLVQSLVNERVVQATVNPVDPEVGEGNEKRE